MSDIPPQLQRMFSGVQGRFLAELQGGRDVFGHPGAKGNVSEREWVALLQKHLPERYRVDNAFVIDSEGHISQQIDVVVYDRHFTPELYLQQGERLIPAESVYAVFEVKQNLSAEHVTYAREKVASVRALARTSAPIYHAGGTFPPRPLPRILGGLLTYTSDYSPAFSAAALAAIQGTTGDGLLNLVCVAESEAVLWDESRITAFSRYPIAAFYMSLIDLLQKVGSVPAIDYSEYLKHLK